MFTILLIYFFSKYIYQSYIKKQTHEKLELPISIGKQSEELSEKERFITKSNSEFPSNDNGFIYSISRSLRCKPKLEFSPPECYERYEKVYHILEDLKNKGQIQKVVDFGCSNLEFLCYLKGQKWGDEWKHLRWKGFKEILCVDIDREVLQNNLERAKLSFLPLQYRPSTQLVVKICEGSVTHHDKQLENTDAVTCLELIEHLCPDTLIDLPFNIFGYIKPKIVIITTPNADFNVLLRDFFEYRHPDHKFQWTRKQFQDWAQNIVERYPDYSVTFHGICYGPEGTEERGPYTQMAVFRLHEERKRCNQVSGVNGLFNVLGTYEYPYYPDDRMDKQKILEEATQGYYTLIHDSHHIVHTVKLLDLIRYMHDYYKPIEEEVLREILVEAGWDVSKSHGAVYVPKFPLSSDSSTDKDTSNNFYLTNNNEENIDQHKADVSANANEEYVLLPNPYHHHYSKELSIIIPQDDSVDESNNTFTESNSVMEEYYESENLVSTDSDNKYSDKRINHSIESVASTEKERLINLIACTLNDAEELIRNDMIPIPDANASFLLTVPPASTSMFSNNEELIDAMENSQIDYITTQSTPLRGGHLETAQEFISKQMLNFQPHPSVSISSTSPEPFLFDYSELKNSLQDYNTTDANVSYNQSLLNNIVYQSEARCEEDINIQEFTTEELACKQVFSERDFIRKNKIDISDSEHIADYFETDTSHNFEQDNFTSVKEDQVCNINDNIDTMSLNICGNTPDCQPKFTSSPRIQTNLITTTIPKQSSPECKEPLPIINSLLSTMEVITKVISNPYNSLSESTSQQFSSISSSTDNNTSEMMQFHTIPLNSNVTNSLKSTIEDTSIDNAQKELCLDNNKPLEQHSTCVRLLQFFNEVTTEKKDTVNYETNIMGDIQNTDLYHKLLLDKNIEQEEDITSRLTTKTENVEIKTEQMINDLIQKDINEKDSCSHKGSPSSSKSQNSRKYSSPRCAKENNENDRFIPCKDNGDTHDSQSTSVLKSGDEIEHDLKVCTIEDKDIKVLNIAELIDNTELKSRSPLETPSTSWSPEIMDSGYPNSTSIQDITPEYDLSSIAQDHVPDSESPSIAEAPRFGVLEPVEVENGDLANNNRDDEGNNMIAVDVDDLEDLQPFIDVLENDLENENDIYVLQNGFPLWLLRILNMVNPLDIQALRVADEVAAHINHDEGFDSSSSENDSSIDNEIDNDNEND